MNWRDLCLWAALALFLGGLYWLRTTHMIRVDFNAFFAILVAMSAAVVVLAWIVKPRDSAPDDPSDTT